jgi:hypothetical protein
MRNMIGGEIKLVSKPEFYALFSPDAQDQMERLWAEEGTTGFICYENLQMDSSNFGHRSALAFGTGRSTGRSADEALEVTPRLGDVPSRFQYPVAYCTKYDAYSNHHEKDQS